jgi:ATP-dependent DNA ligase
MITDMKLFRPMLAEKLDKLPSGVVNWKDWVAEEKYDGNRVIIVVGVDGKVVAYNRPRKKSKDTMDVCEELSAAKAPHLINFLKLLPAGVYDGELCAGDTATDVKRKDLAEKRRVVLFDLLFVFDHSTMGKPWTERRQMLELAHSIMRKGDGSRYAGHYVELSTTLGLTSKQDVMAFFKSVTSRGGEGLIVKRRASLYHSNKRSTEWAKIKKFEHYVLTVTGFEATRGTVMKRGPFAVVLLKDGEGNATSCKTKDDFELERLEKVFRDKYGAKTNVDMATLPHPWVGRKLVIECGGRTRDGGYKGPVIWDRWENE